MSAIVIKTIDDLPKKTRAEALAEGRAVRAANVKLIQNAKEERLKLLNEKKQIVNEGKQLQINNKKDIVINKKEIKALLKTEPSLKIELEELNKQYNLCKNKILKAKLEAAATVNSCMEEQKAIRLKQAQIRRLQKKQGTFVSKRKKKLPII